MARSSARLSLLLLLIFVCISFLTYHSLSFFLAFSDRRNSSPPTSASDSLVKMPREILRPGRTKRRFHTAVTATSALYNRWQCRIMYYWYQKLREEPGSEMGGFTRVLHSGEPDSLMDEIPTFVVDPLPPGMDKGYVVLNRPWAFVQWLQKANIEEDYIFMSEPDHIIVKPIPNLALDDLPVAFPFFYITPMKYQGILRKYFPGEKGPISNIDPIGNSPVIIKKSTLLRIAPTWANISVQLKNDPVADSTFGWVLEMYGYAVASALHGVQHILQKNFMVQPPWDTALGEAYMIHYTYGCDYTMKGELTYGKVGDWRFDKRSYIRKPMPTNLTLPPPGVPETVVKLVQMVNEATSNLPNWSTQ